MSREPSALKEGFLKLPMAYLCGSLSAANPRTSYIVSDQETFAARPLWELIERLTGQDFTLSTLQMLAAQAKPEA